MFVQEIKARANFRLRGAALKHAKFNRSSNGSAKRTQPAEGLAVSSGPGSYLQLAEREGIRQTNKVWRGAFLLHDALRMHLLLHI
mmetsp:Transcript_48254/g.35437  ORF Transcript_48254/g.35437 Transcript_48254/m.35437 type:complete len:85 (+) Transcript_48254:347-601(+)